MGGDYSRRFLMEIGRNPCKKGLWWTKAENQELDCDGNGQISIIKLVSDYAKFTYVLKKNIWNRPVCIKMTAIPIENKSILSCMIGTLTPVLLLILFCKILVTAKITGKLSEWVSEWKPVTFSLQYSFIIWWELWSSPNSRYEKSYNVVAVL